MKLGEELLKLADGDSTPAASAPPIMASTDEVNEDARNNEPAWREATLKAEAWRARNAFPEWGSKMRDSSFLDRAASAAEAPQPHWYQSNSPAQNDRSRLEAATPETIKYKRPDGSVGSAYTRADSPGPRLGKWLRSAQTDDSQGGGVGPSKIQKPSETAAPQAPAASMAGAAKPAAPAAPPPPTGAPAPKPSPFTQPEPMSEVGQPRHVFPDYAGPVRSQVGF